MPGMMGLWHPPHTSDAESGTHAALFALKLDFRPGATHRHRDTLGRTRAITAQLSDASSNVREPERAVQSIVET
jgi:hypothetical protein